MRVNNQLTTAKQTSQNRLRLKGHPLQTSFSWYPILWPHAPQKHLTSQNCMAESVENKVHNSLLCTVFLRSANGSVAEIAYVRNIVIGSDRC